MDGSEDEWLPSNSSDLLQLISDDEKVTSDSEDEDDENTQKSCEKKKPIRWSKKAFQTPDISFVNRPIEQQHTLESPYTYFSKNFCEVTFHDLLDFTFDIAETIIFKAISGPYQM